MVYRNLINQNGDRRGKGKGLNLHIPGESSGRKQINTHIVRSCDELEIAGTLQANRRKDQYKQPHSLRRPPSTTARCQQGGLAITLNEILETHHKPYNMKTMEKG
jgi:hypothetical protein